MQLTNVSLGSYRLIFDINSDKGTALHHASTEGQTAIVKLLIDHICQKNKQLLDAPDKKGKTPLQFAVQEGI